MKRQSGHPDVEALANFRAGLVEGIHGRRIAAHIARCERCAQLSEQLSAVTWALASVPAPAMPDPVERRIGAAIAAEAAARQAASLMAGSMADPSAPSAASPAPAGLAAAERRHARHWSPRRALGSVGPRLRLSPVQMLIPAVVFVLLAGLGYLLSMPRAAGMPSSSSAGAASARSSSASGKVPTTGGPHRDAISPPSAIGPGVGVPFLVTVGTTPYRKSTLRTQVSSQLARQALAPVIGGTPGSESNGTPGNQEGTGGGASRPNTGSVPNGQLVGCVKRLTGDIRPALVQRATYQAEPVYVIAVPTRAWVVHLSCTAAEPALITSVALAPAG
ncbi:MAG TPA: hypothetical protein VF482_15205 [Trebonia sp.]